MAWLHSLELGGLRQETLAEYLATHESLKDRVERLDRRIFQGIKAQSPWPCWRRTAILRGLAVRVALPPFWVLTPGEASSGEQQTRLGITKAGKSHLRRLLVEAAQSIVRGRIGYKSKDLKARQRGNTAQVIAYADRTNERLRRKY